LPAGETTELAKLDQAPSLLRAIEVDPVYWTSKRVVLGGMIKRPAAPFQRAAPAAELLLGLGSD
jgi:hypothetical protein